MTIASLSLTDQKFLKLRQTIPDCRQKASILIVTSPPYANNAIDYMRAHKFSLVWLGWKIDDLTNIRKQYLGHDALGGKTVRVVAGTMRIDAGCTGAGRYEKICGAATILWRDACCYPGNAPGTETRKDSYHRRWHIHPARHRCRNTQGTRRNRGKHRLQPGGYRIRHLDRDKRMMPARWGKTRQSQIEERMHEEYVIGLLKQ